MSSSVQNSYRGIVWGNVILGESLAMQLTELGSACHYPSSAKLVFEAL